MCKRDQQQLLFLLVHPGGPYFKNKDLGSWSIPKGLQENEEDPLSSACREFKEEIGIIPEAPFYDLGEIKQKGGKIVRAWAFLCPQRYSKWDPNIDLISNTFAIEWPPRSGKTQTFPEVDQAAWFDYSQASQKLNPAQVELLNRALVALIE